MNPSPARQTCRALILALLIAFGPDTLRAQAVPDDTVRVTSVQRTYEGTLSSLDSTALVMHSYNGLTLRFPVASISNAAVLRGRYRDDSRIGKGALIGLGISTAIGLYAYQDRGGSREAPELKGIRTGAIILSGTLVGTVIGGVMAFRKLPNWQRFDPRYPAAVSTPR